MQNRFHLSREEKRRLSDAVSSFSRYRILVVGDLMLDTFIWGDVRRVSPEAPVPLVEVVEETKLLGGTANVVHNVAALRGKAVVAGAIGDDSAGRELLRLFGDIGVPTDGLIVERDRPTTLKTRIIAQNQQVARFDRESRGPLPKNSTERVLAYIRANLQDAHAMIISDYAKGMVTQEFMDAIRSLTLHSDLPVIVDPKVQHTDLYRGVTMVTPNHHEASLMAAMEIRDEASLVSVGKRLLKRLECKTVLITRGKQGMNLFDGDGQMTYIPTVARRVYDVTGAGDTVLATITLGIASGLPMVEAAMLANLAAGIVVGEVGTAAVSADQLLGAIRDSS